MFPLKVLEISKEQKERFNKYFVEEDGKFMFEGMWLRDQREKNKNQSGWESDEKTKRRRYVHFVDHYTVLTEGQKEYLAVADAYLCVSNTLPSNELEIYANKIYEALKKNGFVETEKGLYKRENLLIEFKYFDNHPKNKEGNVSFPEGYCSLDIFVYSEGNEFESHYDRMWEHSTKMFRIPDKRENPLYATDVKLIEKYLPAQVEMGCGPSIEVGIPPLHGMHETYKVQNHLTHKFYFADMDYLIFQIIENPLEMYKRFSRVPILCLTSEHSDAYLKFKKYYDKGLFVGTVYNNNFDRLVKRLGIPEFILRIYDKKRYLPKIDFDPKAKSLICFGSHADRRMVQKQAREKGLQIIFVDPEGFDTPNGFDSYPIEGPKDGDIIFKMPFSEFMDKFDEYFEKRN